MAHWVGTQGQVKLAKKSRKHALIVTSPQKTSNPKRIFFFKFQLEDLLNP